MAGEENHEPAPPALPEDYRDAGARLACLAIDQAIVDGYITSEEVGVSLATLVSIAAEGKSLGSAYDAFRWGLVNDSRYVGKVRRDYAYVPVMSGDNDVSPRPEPILLGITQCSEVGRQEVVNRMQGYMDVLLTTAMATAGHPFTFGQIKGLLKKAGARLSYQEFGGFIAFLCTDDRFITTPSGAKLVQPGEGDARSLDQKLNEAFRRTRPRHP